jgi:hypothetical protein
MPAFQRAVADGVDAVKGDFRGPLPTFDVSRDTMRFLFYFDSTLSVRDFIDSVK